MKTPIIIFFSLCFNLNLFAFSGGHDSLLFDGENVHSVNSHTVNSNYVDSCMVLIALNGVSGKVEGMVARDTIEIVGCGLTGNVRKCEWKQLHEADELCPDDSVVTGPTGTVLLVVGGDYKFPFVNKIINVDNYRIGSNSVVYPPKCPSNTAFLLSKGKMKIRETRENVKKKVIETYRSFIEPEGTEYSVESDEKADIIRVYEGSVKINLKLLQTTGEDNAVVNITKLSDDLMNGKISPEEYQKMMKDMADNLRATVTVGAGFQITIAGKFGEVIPIENDDKWWEK